MTTLYHCSPVKIEQFDYSNGVHFGGLYSALEAGLRKGSDVLYLHTVDVQFDSCYETDDVGNAEAWSLEIKKALEVNFNIIKYRNKYEPDSTPSYIILDKSLVKSLSIESLSSNRAEELILNNFY